MVSVPKDDERGARHMNPAQQVFCENVWKEAYQRYYEKTGGELDKVTPSIQVEYILRAHQELRQYLAMAGIT